MPTKGPPCPPTPPRRRVWIVLPKVQVITIMMVKQAGVIWVIKEKRIDDELWS
jgi:hypothetical protein